MYHNKIIFKVREGLIGGFGLHIILGTCWEGITEEIQVNLL